MSFLTEHVYDKLGYLAMFRSLIFKHPNTFVCGGNFGGDMGQRIQRKTFIETKTSRNSKSELNYLIFQNMLTKENMSDILSALRDLSSGDFFRYLKVIYHL